MSHKHNNKDLSHLQQLSSGMQPNTKYINTTKGISSGINISGLNSLDNTFSCLFLVVVPSLIALRCVQMWACAKGQIDAALTLYHWNAGALGVCNKDGQLPLALARQRGHHNLAAQVEQLEQAHFKTPAPAPAKVSVSHMPASPPIASPSVAYGRSYD